MRSRINALADRVSLAPVVFITNDADRWNFRLKAVGDFGGAVGAAVNDQNFGFGHSHGYGAHTLLNVLFLVKAGDDDGDAWVGFHARVLENAEYWLVNWLC